MRSGRHLDALNALIAAVQTGFGPFIAVHLGTQGWGQAQIGVALSLSTVTVMIAQLPAGLWVDGVRDKRNAARLALLGLAGAALLLALWPARGPVYGAMVMQGAASSLLGPAIAAISLGLVGRRLLGERLGRNARFASIGNVVMAAAMGLTGGLVTGSVVFATLAALMLPAWLALRRIDLAPHRRPARAPDAPTGWREIARLLRNPRLTIFAFCIGAFHLANAAMLPLAAAGLSRDHTEHAALIVAASIVLQPIVVALCSPWIGRFAEHHGRRAPMLAGWAMLPAQAVLLAFLPTPWLLPLTQIPGGIAVAVFAVMLPLVAADMSYGTNRFTLCLSSLSLPIAIGAALSTTLAGLVADRLGEVAAFLGLGLAGLGGTALLWLAMPETRVAINGDMTRPT